MTDYPQPVVEKVLLDDQSLHIVVSLSQRLAATEIRVPDEYTPAQYLEDVGVEGIQLDSEDLVFVDDVQEVLTMNEERFPLSPDEVDLPTTSE